LRLSGHSRGPKNTIVATRIARLAIPVETLRKERVPDVIQLLVKGCLAPYLRRGAEIQRLNPRSDRARPDIVTTIRPTTQVAPIALTAARSDSLQSNGNTPRIRASRPTSHVAATRLARIILTAACPDTVKEIPSDTQSRASRPAKRTLAKRGGSITVAAAHTNYLKSFGSSQRARVS
jgi:hypothetical protein